MWMWAGSLLEASSYLPSTLMASFKVKSGMARMARMANLLLRLLIGLVDKMSYKS